MLTSIAFVFAGLSIAVFIHMGGPLIVWLDVKDKYRRFRKLNKLVATQYKPCCMIFWVSIQILCKSLWLSFMQWANNSVQKADRQRYEVSYIINGRLYKMIVKPVRGPAPILLAVDENQEDITSKLVPYLGPQRDFHGFKLTPQFLGYQEISAELSTGETVTFGETETIVVE
jgi:hypothetical protein